MGHPINRALVVRKPYAGMIVDGEKVWEMRSRPTNIRGRVGIIEARSGTIIGEVDLVDCWVNLSQQQLLENISKHKVFDSWLLTHWPIAWVFDNAERYDKPVPYVHPHGAVGWVRL